MDTTAEIFLHVLDRINRALHLEVSKEILIQFNIMIRNHFIFNQFKCYLSKVGFGNYNRIYEYGWRYQSHIGICFKKSFLDDMIWKGEIIISYHN